MDATAPWDPWDRRRNFRGYKGYAFSALSGVRGTVPRTFKRYKRPSFELKLRRNAWPAEALPGPRWGELTALHQTALARLKTLLLKGKDGRGGEVVRPLLGRKSRLHVGRVPPALEITGTKCINLVPSNCRSCFCYFSLDSVGNQI